MFQNDIGSENGNENDRNWMENDNTYSNRCLKNGFDGYHDHHQNNRYFLFELTARLDYVNDLEINDKQYREQENIRITGNPNYWQRYVLQSKIFNDYGYFKTTQLFGFFKKEKH